MNAPLSGLTLASCASKVVASTSCPLLDGSQGLAAGRRVGLSLQPIAPCHVQIWGVLVVVGATGWWSIDSTRQGLALALVAAAVCPLAEIGLMNVGGLWHYPHPDAFGIVSW